MGDEPSADALLRMASRGAGTESNNSANANHGTAAITTLAGTNWSRSNTPDARPFEMTTRARVLVVMSDPADCSQDAAGTAANASSGTAGINSVEPLGSAWNMRESTVRKLAAPATSIDWLRAARANGSQSISHNRSD